VQQAKPSIQRAQIIQRETKEKGPQHQHQQQQQQQKTHSKTQAFSNAKKALEETRQPPKNSSFKSQGKKKQKRRRRSGSTELRKPLNSR
jgi:hypothetical protein